ncbi:Pycsar system effector family protein [Phenylobacterium sp.]|uniref:Pycsar system effector family protein n=1 Tax=Phenylobacterium sp. TaxID=1871053 RepID=UPI002BDCEAD3|nr:Pycsar system effector family protein [Phenylobacterium sp.]HLZ75811.1 Pycsar system effector family protein [Phenylobacterium sp.]
MADGERALEAAGLAEAALVGTGPAGQPPYGPDTVQLLRNTQQIQYQLSQMADQKASMLLAITFVIFSLSLGQSHPGAIPQAPVLILGGTAFLAATLAVLAVLPSVKTPGPAQGAPNILFFGAFSHMSEDQYIRTLLSGLTDNHAVFQAFARDIYQNGQVLSGKKYRLLGWAYRILLLGLFSSATAWITPYAAHAAGLR